MANQHFFKPLLPRFHSHLTIPVAFFLKRMDRKYEQTMAELRSDASKKTWQVKVEDGRKLTDGWKEFALAHDLRIGDFLIFRHEKDMSFHVTLFGSSCCEIQYESCLHDQNNLGELCVLCNSVHGLLTLRLTYKRFAQVTKFKKESQVRLRIKNLPVEKTSFDYCQSFSGKIQRKKKVTKNQRRETESSSLDPSCFVANVTPSTLRYDRLNLPSSFVKANGLGRRCEEIVLMNAKGRSWTLDLKGKRSYRVIYITRGWRNFCHANGFTAGDSFTFKLIRRGKTRVLRLSSPKESEEEEEEDCSSEANEIESLSTEPDSEEEKERSSKENKGRSIWKASSSAPENRFVKVTLTPNNIRLSKLVLPIPFTKVNGIKNAKKMSLLDIHGVKWSTNLRFEKNRKRMRLVGGWKEFCGANGVTIGESIVLELIWEADRSSVLKFCSKVNP